MNITKSTAPYHLHPWLLNELSKELSYPILIILFSKSLSTGTVLKEWRLTNVTAVFKVGDRIDARNYKPVNLMYIFM